MVLTLCQRIMVSASNISPQQQDTANHDTETTVLVLPAFLYVDRMTAADIPAFVERYVDGEDDATEQEEQGQHLLSRPCTRDYIVLLCSHRTRDRRCGISAPLIKQELERQLRRQSRQLLRDDADDSRPGGVGIFFVSHLSGHKFAANVLVYRREARQMIWLARVRPEHCEGIVRYTIPEGKIVCPEDRLRGGVDWEKDVMSW